MYCRPAHKGSWKRSDSFYCLRGIGGSSRSSADEGGRGAGRQPSSDRCPGRLHCQHDSSVCASTVYHTLDISEKVNRLLRKLDHMMIFILIAGTYTPICLIVLGNRSGFLLLALVWAIAAAGILINAFWISCPKWFSSLIYISMGWVCVTAFREIISALPPAAFSWLLAGGIIYTAGGVIYALKLPIFNSRHKNFGSHEIFHLFVMGGSLCHYVVMYAFVA